MLTEKMAWEYLADNYKTMQSEFLCINLYVMSSDRIITIETRGIMTDKIMEHVDRLFSDKILKFVDSFTFFDKDLNQEQFRIDFCRARAEEL